MRRNGGVFFGLSKTRSLIVLARETGISVRTLQRWLQLYRAGGVAALDPHPRTDKGVRRTSSETVAFIERLAAGHAQASPPCTGSPRGAHALPVPSYDRSPDRSGTRSGPYFTPGT